MYNDTALTAANNLYETVRELNILSAQLLAIMLLTTLFLALLFVFRKYEGDFKSNLLASSMITTVIAVMMWSIDFLAMNVLLYPIAALFASILMYIFND